MRVRISPPALGRIAWFAAGHSRFVGTWPIARRLAAVLVVVIIGGGVAAWGYLNRTDGVPVAMVGDSMADQARSNLARAGHGAGFDVSIDATFGIALDQELPKLEQVAAGHPERVVVELGTNDVLGDTTIGDLQSRVDKEILYFSSTPCVLFVEVGLVRDHLALADRFNGMLTDAVASHPNMHVYDWASDYHQHPDWTQDGIHLQPQFRDNFANGVVGALRSSCPPPSNG